jgi:hypothetical protein
LTARVSKSIPAWNPSDPADFGVVLVEAFSYLGDIMSYYIDRAANESTLSTATRRVSVTALARDLGYEPAGYAASTTTLSFTNSSASPINLPAGTVVNAPVQSGDALLNIPFQTVSAVTVPAATTVGGVTTPGSVSVTGTQGQTVSGTGYGVSLGQSYGSVNQYFEIPESKIIKESVVVYVYDGVNYYPWQKVDRITDYSPTSRVFSVIDDGFQTFYVNFGDGVSGFIPTSGSLIYAKYTAVDGTNGNVPAGSITEVISIPGLSDSVVAALAGTLTVSNTTAATGGTDPEDLTSIRYNASQVYRTSNRAVTLDDYQNIALSVTSCGKASATSSVPGTVVVAVAPVRNVGSVEQRPGFAQDPDTLAWSETTTFNTLKTNVLSAINNNALAGSTTSTVSPLYSSLLIGVSVTALPSVRQSDAATIVKQAILERLDYSNVGFGATIYSNELISLVSSLGVASSVSLTNFSRKADAPATSDLTGAFNEIFIIAEADLGVSVTGGATG